MSRELESTADVVATPQADDLTATVVGDTIAAEDLHHVELVPRGKSIGRYVVVEKLGSGAMGTVYRAFDPELDRSVALKLVEARGTRWRNPTELRTRIMREAQAIARLQHPNVVQVFDVGEVEFAVWVAMEFVDGFTLKQWAREPGRTWQEVVEAFVQAGRGLSAAHRAEIIHRDFKPENAMIGRDGRVRVLDFGLARAVSGPTTAEPARREPTGSDGPSRERVALDASMTAHGLVMGTPAYMSPEQHLGRPTTAASDQFSFCISMWEALYGQRPFQGETHAAVAFAATRGKITPAPSDRAVPRWIVAVMLRGLEIKSDERYRDMDTLVDALLADPARRRRRVLGGVAVATALVATAAGARALGPAQAADKCTGAPERVRGIWDPTRRAAIAAAFEGTGLPFAVDSLATISTSLDEWSEQWVATRTAACEATHVLGEQSLDRMDLRMLCLDRHLTDLSALVDVLQTAEHDVVVGAIDATRRLPSLSTCNDLEYLTARVPPPASPDRAAELASLREASADINARTNAGAFAGLAERLAALHDRVTALDHPPLSADFFELLGSVELSTGDAHAARRSWERAFAMDLRAGDTRSAAFAASKLVFIVGHKLSLREDGERWAALARELARTTHDDGRVLASLWSAEASMLAMDGDYTGALEIEHRVRDFWLQEDPIAPELGICYGNQGNAKLMQGDHEAAIRLIQLDVDSMSANYGPHHPETGASQARLASALSHARRFDEARPLFTRAIEVMRESEGESSTRLATAIDGLGRVLRQQGQLQEAVTQHRAALAVWRDALGDTHPDVAVSLMHVGYTLAAMDDWQGALGVFDEAAAVFEGSVGADHPQMIYVANSRASMHVLLDNPSAAISLLERALGLDATRQVDPTLLAETRFILAQALWNGEVDRARALQLAEEARSTYAGASDIWADDLKQIVDWLAEHRAH